MNQRQRIVIFLGSLLIAAMLAFPPMRGWHKGYGFVFNQRSTYISEFDTTKSGGYDSGWRSWRIDQERLVYQILITIALMIGFVVLVGKTRKP